MTLSLSAAHASKQQASKRSLSLKMCGGQALNCDICMYTQQPEDLDLVFTIWKMSSRVAKGDSMSAQQNGRWKSCTDN